MIAKPNFFIVGTPKSGTTSLFNYLEEHPEVFVPKIKEPHYFSYPEVAATYYKTTIVDSIESYEALYAKALNFRAIGDLSSSYLFHPNSANRIAGYNPNAKIVVVLRNPVERAVSHYLMDHNLGLIECSLKEVIENPKEQQEFYQQYVELGYYENQLKRYIEVFDEDQLLILLSDDLFQNTERTIIRLFEFLGVDSTFKPDLDKKYNQFKEPRFKFVNKLKHSKIVRSIFDRLPQRIKNLATRAAFDATIEKPVFDEEKVLLSALYRPHMDAIEQLIGRDLSSWRRPEQL